MENKKYEFAKSYSNHDGIVEILSVEINSENREKNDEDDGDEKKVDFFYPFPGLDWIGFTSGYRVATALRIVYWPSLSLLGSMLRGQVGCSS